MESTVRDPWIVHPAVEGQKKRVGEEESKKIRKSVENLVHSKQRMNEWVWIIVDIYDPRFRSEMQNKNEGKFKPSFYPSY